MDFSLILIIGVIVGTLLIGFFAYLSLYRTVAPDKALIITGDKLGNKNVVQIDANKRLKIIRGGGTVVIPFIQKAKEIETSSIKLEVKGEDVLTQNGVPITVEGTTLIKVGSKIEEIATAAEQFPGGIPEIQDQAKSVLEGHLRSILASMTVEDAYKDRTKFAQEVQKIAVEDLNNMGLQIVSFTIRDVRDKEGYLEALGKKQIAEVKKQADIATADADKETRIQRALAEQQARDKEIEKETVIAEKTKDMELKKAMFKEEQDRASAKANQSYSIQEAISKREVVEAEMEIQKIQKDREIEIQEKEITRRKKELDATVKNQADADLYQRQKAAEASKYEEEQNAHAEAIANVARAEADAKAQIARAKAEAEAGLAEAQAIEAKGKAEALVAEAKAKVEVEREMGLADAAIKVKELKSIEFITRVLPDVAGKIAEPMGNVDKITIVDTGGDGSGVGKMASSVTNIMHTLPNIVEDMTGVKLGNIVNNLTGGRVSGTNPEILNLVKQVSENPQLLEQLRGILNNPSALLDVDLDMELDGDQK